MMPASRWSLCAGETSIQNEYFKVLLKLFLSVDIHCRSEKDVGKS